MKLTARAFIDVTGSVSDKEPPRVLGGAFVFGPQEMWDALGGPWKATLQRFGLAAFHSRTVRQQMGEEKARALSVELAAIIAGHFVERRLLSLDPADFDELSVRYELRAMFGGPYGFLMFHVIDAAVKMITRLPQYASAYNSLITLIEKGDRKQSEFEKLIKDPTVVETVPRANVLFVSKGLTMLDGSHVPHYPLEVADFWAWHWRQLVKSGKHTPTSEALMWELKDKRLWIDQPIREAKAEPFMHISRDRLLDYCEQFIEPRDLGVSISVAQRSPRQASDAGEQTKAAGDSAT